MGKRLHKATVETELTELMTELARYLLSAGISSSRFGEISRVAYFRAASLKGRFGNNRVNKSAIAAMTGLTRSQVRTYSREGTSEMVLGNKPDRIENVVIGWMRDPAYCTSNYKPKKLRIAGRNSSFSTLVRKYGGDVPARSILRELVRTKQVKVDGPRASLQLKGVSTPGVARLKHLAESLATLLHVESDRSDLPNSFLALGGEIETPATSAIGRILLDRRSVGSLRSLLSSLQAAGDAAAVESPPGQKRRDRAIRTRVLILREELAPRKLASRHSRRKSK
jgi:hypothetical protein